MNRDNDYRYKLLMEYSELMNDWDKNNMLYNSLRFYQIYNGDVENSELVKEKLIGNGPGERNDIMTSWWTPVKCFLRINSRGNRKELTAKLLSEIPRENDIAQLQAALSDIRYGNGKLIAKDTIQSLLDFLEVVYSIGNLTGAAMTTRGGALDNWDAKLENIKRKHFDSGEWTEEKWRKYVEDNKFQGYFEDSTYKKIKPFWAYGACNLTKASDNDWREYFSNAKERIEARGKCM